MRTYSHAVLTLAATRRFGLRTASAATLGSVIPDLPVAAGAIWLWFKRGIFTRDQLQQEACARKSFAAPDSALHSAVVLAAVLVLCGLLAIKRSEHRRPLLAFLLGWAGHVAADALTHGKDARPLLWPLSERRFRSPISYWEKSRYGRLFATIELAAVLASGLRFLVKR